jgi:hypothetical protein
LAACDCTIQIEKTEISRSATVQKSNDAAEGEKVFFNLESVDLGPETTAPVVRPTEPPSVTAKGPKLTANQQTMYSLLREAGQGGLSTDEWNARALDIGIGSKRKADPYDIRAALKSKTLVREFNGRWTASN